MVNNSHLAKVTPGDEQCELQRFPNEETRCALLGNLFLSEGKSGNVLHVHCKRRIGEKNFIQSIREILAEKYTGKTVGNVKIIHNSSNLAENLQKICWYS